MSTHVVLQVPGTNVLENANADCQGNVYYLK